MSRQGDDTPHSAMTLSDLLASIDLSGQSWCYCDIGGGGGFSIPASQSAFFYAVLHGTLRLATAGGGTATLTAGQCAMVLAGEAHALRLTAESRAVTLDFLREDRQVEAPPTFALGQPGPIAARVLCGRLTITLPSGSNRSSLPAIYPLNEGTCREAMPEASALAAAGIGPGAATLLTRVAATMLVARLRSDPQCRQMFSPEPNDPIDQALKLIAGNPSANWTVERLARSVGMGRSNFAAHFTTRVGRAPMEVVAEARMDQAAQLLRKGRLKIAEISELSGYGSEAAFSRRFTRHFGMSPSQMREVLREEESQAVEAAPSWQPLLLGNRPIEALHRVRRRLAGIPGGRAPAARLFADSRPGRPGN